MGIRGRRSYTLRVAESPKPPEHLELELAPENYRLKLSSLPKVCPDKNFKFRVTGHRHPLEPATEPRWPSDRRDDPRKPARLPAQGLYT